MVKASRTGFIFRVEGIYVGTLEYYDDPKDEDWQEFSTRDLHPAGKPQFTIWVDTGEPDEVDRHDAIARAITIVNWMRGEKGWEGFHATLSMRTRDGYQPVYQWELH